MDESLTDIHVSVVSIQILISDAETEMSKLENILVDPGEKELVRELKERLRVVLVDLATIGE